VQLKLSTNSSAYTNKIRHYVLQNKRCYQKYPAYVPLLSYWETGQKDKLADFKKTDKTSKSVFQLFWKKKIQEFSRSFPVEF